MPIPDSCLRFMVSRVKKDLFPFHYRVIREQEKVPKDIIQKIHSTTRTWENNKTVFYKYLYPDVGCEKQLCNKGVERGLQQR